MNDQHQDLEGTDREFEIVDGKLAKTDSDDVDFEEDLTFDG